MFPTPKAEIQSNCCKQYKEKEGDQKEVYYLVFKCSRKEDGKLSESIKRVLLNVALTDHQQERSHEKRVFSKDD